MSHIFDNLTELKDAVDRRVSVRSYDGSPLSVVHHQMMREAAADALAYVNAQDSRIVLVDNEADIAPLSTYGVIAGCSTYLVLISRGNSRQVRTRLAAAAELCVLYATSQQIASCWVGGTFKRSSFATAASLVEGEEIAAIIALGYAAKPRLLDRLMVAVARSRSRKAPEQLFFAGDLQHPLDMTTPTGRALEYLRQAPSSVNCQPWRIIVAEDGSMNVCCATDNTYSDLDMGIAMAHLLVAFAPRNLVFGEPTAAFPRLIGYFSC